MNDGHFERANLTEKSSAVFGVYVNRLAAEKAVEAFLAKGFPLQEISLLQSHSPSTHLTAKEDQHADGAAMGAGTGAIIGGTLGLLAGIGALAIPGFGPFIAAGPIMAILGGVGVGGAVGSVSGTLVGLGIPEYEAKLYETHFNEGKVLLSVHTGTIDETGNALRILQSTHAADITLKEDYSGKNSSTGSTIRASTPGSMADHHP